MSIPNSIPAPIVETVLFQLIPLFLSATKGDREAARQAALERLGTYQPHDAMELTLAATIIGFSYHAEMARHQATDPKLSPNMMARMLKNEASMRREAERSRKELEKVQMARRARQEPVNPTPAPVRRQPVRPPALPAVPEAVLASVGWHRSAEGQTIH
jgi:hypothetical protein